MAKLPQKINILGTDFTVIYCEHASDVDVHKRESFWGMIDYWTSTIRVFKSGITIEMWKTIFHELLHGIGNALKLEMLENKDNHDDLDVLAVVLVDCMVRNGWLVIDDEGETA